MTALLGQFREAMMALIPIAESVHMPWREPSNYDDWDEICSSLYKSIVINSCNNKIDGALCHPILKYDKRVASYKNNSYIGCAKLGCRNAFVCFQTIQQPFDSCLFVELDESSNVIAQKLIGFREIQFTLVEQKKEGVTILNTIEVAI